MRQLLLILLLVLPMWPVPPAAAATADLGFDVRRLAAGVYAMIRQVIAALLRITAKPVLYVINTHAHVVPAVARAFEQATVR